MLAAPLFPDLDHLNKMCCLPMSQAQSGYRWKVPRLVHNDIFWRWAMSLFFMIYEIASLSVSNSISQFVVLWQGHFSIKES